MRVWRAAPDTAAHEDAGAVFVGATRYTGPFAWLRLARKWFAMVEQMRRLPGYRGHGVYYERPWTLGTVGFFTSHDDLMLFARSGEHRALMHWVVGGDRPGDRRNATGGYIRVYRTSDTDTGAAGNTGRTSDTDAGAAGDTSDDGR